VSVLPLCGLTSPASKPQRHPLTRISSNAAAEGLASVSLGATHLTLRSLADAAC
jgi:hypothetical protein